MLLISTSWVQSSILKQITQNFEKSTQQQINFDKISLKWNGKFELSGVFIGDHHDDTLAYVKKIRASFYDLNRLQQNDFNFDELDASGVYLNIKKYPNETFHSLKVLVQKLKNVKAKKNESIFNVEKLSLIESQFTYSDLNSENKAVQLVNLGAEASKIIFKGDTLSLNLSLLDGKINSPFGENIKTKAKVLYHPGVLELEEWELFAEENSLMGSLSLYGKDNSFQDFLNKGRLELNVQKSQWNLSPFLTGKSWGEELNLFSAQFYVSGALNDFKVESLLLNHEEFDFSGGLSVQNFLDQNSSWQLNLEEASVSTDRLTDNIKSLAGINKYLKIERIQFEGRIESKANQIDFSLNSNNSWGNFITSGFFNSGVFFSEKAEKTFFIKSDFESMKLIPPMGSKAAVKWGGALELNGDLSEKEAPELDWKIAGMYIETPNNKFSDIALEGNYNKRQIRNTLGVENSLVGLKSDLLFDFSNTIPEYTLAANLTKWDLNHLGLRLGQGKREFQGVILGTLKGQNIDDLSGSIKISSAKIKNENEVIDINPITISQRFVDGETQLEIINSDCISGVAKGKFKTSQLRYLFQHTLHEVYPFLPFVETQKGQELTFNLKLYKKLLDALYPDFSISENISLKGTIDSDIKNSNITLDAPLLRWDTAQLENLHFQIDTNNPIYNTFLSVDKLSHPYFKGKAFQMISTELKDTLYFRSEFTKQGEENTPFEVNFYHTMDEDIISHFGLKKSILPLGLDSWVVNPEDIENQKISYNLETKETVISSLSAISASQAIALEGSYLSPKQYALKVDIQNFKLENINSKSSLFNQSGNANFKLDVLRSVQQNSLEFSGDISDWEINKQDFGEFEIEASGNTLMNAYVVEFNLAQSTKNEITAKGVWQGWDDPKVDMNISFDDFNLGFLSPLGKEAINNIGGKLTGDVNLWGPIQELKHDGILSLQNAQFSIPYLNINYQANETDVRLSNQDFVFRDVNLFETEEKTSATLGGTFSHVNFRNWSTQLNIESSRMLLLNTPQLEESLFFGQGFLNGKLSLSGPTKNLKISLQGATEPGTAIKIPWAENYGLSDSSFVQFIDKNNREIKSSTDQEKLLKEISGLELDFELDVTNNASIEIVIDQETGSYLSGRGAGNLFMEINTNGKFNMWGDFITYDGIYNFKNLGVIDKKFNVKPGGTIVWEGNPLEAQMDLEAVYSVPGGANPAILLDNPNFNKSIPTEVLIRLQGNLLKPDDPVFEIDFPNTSGTVASEINYRLADPQRSQLQALSLLSQGIFINEVSVSMQGITNNLYQKASDIVSNLIGEENDKLKVGIDYLQGDKSALLDIATEDRLGFTLSTKISDRILLNGKIGVPVGGVEQTLIVGNVQIDFILNEEGSLRAKVFNKENEFRYIGDELGYTQGVGLSYDVDFNTFEDLIQKIIKSQKNSSEIIESMVSDSSVETEIKFIDKN